MAAPTYSWTYQPDAGLDPISSVAATSWRDFNRNAIHCREIAYDTAAHVPIVAHDHDGKNSARIYPPSPNLVTFCKFNDEIDTNGMQVSRSGVSYGEDNRGSAGAAMDASGDNVAVYVGRTGLASAWGTSAKFAVSIFARSTMPNTVGELRFGLTDGSTTTFLAGCRSSVLSSHVDASWKRFWGVMTIPGTITTDLYMLMRVTTSFTNSLKVDCPMVTLGSALSWWWVNPLEGYSADADHYLRDVSQDIPIFDSNVSMRDAVKLAVV